MTVVHLVTAVGPSEDERIRRVLAGRDPVTPAEVRELERARPGYWDGALEALADAERARRRRAAGEAS